jgi:hypothetical protein
LFLGLVAYGSGAQIGPGPHLERSRQFVSDHIYHWGRLGTQELLVTEMRHVQRSGWHWQICIYFSLISFFLFCFADCIIMILQKNWYYKSCFCRNFIKFGSQQPRSANNFVILLESNCITSARFCKTLSLSQKQSNHV